MTTTDWTVEDARALRAEVNAQRTRHARLKRLARPAVHAGYRVARLITRGGSDQRVMHKAAARMNSNQTSAFDGYSPRQGDVVVSAYFKAGTNWVMHICHQIAHLGQAEFEHIQDVIPWPDAAQPRFWINLNDPLPYHSPTGLRVIKSHLPANLVPNRSAARYVAVTRDPKDCAASGYPFFNRLLFGPASPPPDPWLAFCSSEHAICGPWSQHAASWYARRDEPNVLFLHYEDIKREPADTIDTLAAFLGVTLDAPAREQVIARTDFAAMKADNHKFYPVNQSVWSSRGGAIIRAGRVGDSATLFSAAARRQCDTRIASQLAKLDSQFPYHARYGQQTDAEPLA